jgi:hypothetical protein
MAADSSVCPNCGHRTIMHRAVCGAPVYVGNGLYENCACDSTVIADSVAFSNPPRTELPATTEESTDG